MDIFSLRCAVAQFARLLNHQSCFEPVSLSLSHCNVRVIPISSLFLLYSLFFLIMPPQQQSQRNEIVDWYNSIPPITKALFTLSIATTALSGLGFISPSSLILYWPNIRNKLQVNKYHQKKKKPKTKRVLT